MTLPVRRSALPGLAVIEDNLPENFARHGGRLHVPAPGQPPSITLGANIYSNPLAIGHKFGHYVAWVSGFDTSLGGPHYPGYNTRYYAQTRTPTGRIAYGSANWQPLTTREQALAFSEGWADYFCVAAVSGRTGLLQFLALALAFRRYAHYQGGLDDLERRNPQQGRVESG